jgi:hypothetical protein
VETAVASPKQQLVGVTLGARLSAVGEVPVRSGLSLSELSGRVLAFSLTWREGSESDRVPPDLDQRLGLASKPIAKR